MNAVTPPWDNRRAAGRELCGRLEPWRQRPQSLVVALPRGGVAVAAEVADGLALPLVCWSVRKLAHPRAPEVAIGAMASGGVLLWDEPYLQRLQLSPQLRRQLVHEQDQELRRRQRLFGEPAAAALRGQHLLLVDDGVATGLTVRAALTALRRCEPADITLAVPVIDHGVATRLEPLVDDLVALALVDQLEAVGGYFRRFDQLSDQEVLALLTGCRSDPSSSGEAPPPTGRSDPP